MLKLDIQKRTSFYRSSGRCTFQWRQSRSIESFLYLAPPAASAAAARNSPPLNLQSFEDALFLYTDPVPSWINHYRLILIQCHQVPTSRATYWPSTIMYQPVSPSSDPVPPSTEQYRLLLNQYHHISTSTAPYWPSTTKYQSIPTYTDPVPSYINQYHLLLTQYHQVPTAAAFYWPSVIIYQPVPLHTDPVSPTMNHYEPTLLLLGDYRLLHSLPQVLLFKALPLCTRRKKIAYMLCWLEVGPKTLSSYNSNSLSG